MEQNPTHQQVNAQLNHTLRMHLERLLGSEFPPIDFRLDMVAIACLVLLAENEAEAQYGSSENPFTHGSLVEEISTLGFPIDGDFERAFDGMVGAGYVRIREDGTLSTERPLLRMSHLLDLVFPKMPGMNLVAYLVQTSEEVLSGRKDLMSGNRQLDQVLEMQGIPISTGQTDPEPQRTDAPRPQPPAASKKYHVPAREKAREKSAQQAILERLRMAARSDDARNIISGSRIISSNKNKIQTDEVSHPQGTEPIPPAPIPSGVPGELDGIKTEELPEELPEELGKPSHDAPEVYFQEDDITGVSSLDLLETSIQSEGEADGEAIRPAEEIQPVPISGKEPEKEEPGESIPDEREGEPLTGPEGKKDVEADRDARTPIAEFEPDSTLDCPLCGQGRVEPHETSIGKLFYECSREGCHFISWGKPHNLPCPRCGNPFMVENRDGSGRILLKCPRATCGYKQNHPGEDGSIGDEQGRDGREKHVLMLPQNPKPRRKVVRKRVVRRKR